MKPCCGTITARLGLCVHRADVSVIARNAAFFLQFTTDGRISTIDSDNSSITVNSLSFFDWIPPSALSSLTFFVVAYGDVVMMSDAYFNAEVSVTVSAMV